MKTEDAKNIAAWIFAKQDFYSELHFTSYVH